MDEIAQLLTELPPNLSEPSAYEALVTMEVLGRLATGSLSPGQHKEVRAARIAARHAMPITTWSDGMTAHDSLGWNYPNGMTAQDSLGWNYPNGMTARDSLGWNYPNGMTARDSLGWNYPNGMTAESEGSLLTLAIKDLPPGAQDRVAKSLAGLRGDARTLALLTLVWNAQKS